MRLNCSGFSKRLFLAGTAGLALLLVSTLSGAYLPVALAQGGGEGVESQSDADSFGRRVRQIKRARRAQEAAAQGVETDTAPGAGPGFSGQGANPRFDGLSRKREFAGAGMKMRMGNNSGGMNRSPLDLSQLNLTDEQKTRITEQRSKAKGQAKELQAAIKVKRLEMRDMMFDPAYSPEQIRAKRAELRKVQEQAEMLMLNDFLSMRSVLTADQLRRLRPNAAGRGRGIAEAAASSVAPEPATDASGGVTSNFATLNSNASRNKNK
jgi:Spy/CpxP family protein refolding chaperone